MHKILFFLTSLFLYNLTFSQYNFRFQQEYFFGNLPSAKIEAMGRADVAIGGSLPSIFFNPASLARIEGHEVALSTSAPFYVLRQSDYYFAAYGRKIKPGIYAAISLNQFAVGPTHFTTVINGTNYSLDKPKSSNLALTLAAEPIKGLQLGLNANLFNLNFFEDVPAGKALHIDLGALYLLELAQTNQGKQSLSFGASVANVGFSSIRYASPAGDKAESNFPVVARIGAAYLIEKEIALPGVEAGALDITLTAEYQNVLNDDYRTNFQLGAEALAWKVFALRLGFITQSLNSYEIDSNRSRLRDFTYGFGIQVPLADLSEGKLPFKLHLDYVSLKQPPYTLSGSRIPNMRTFTLRISWPLQSQP